MQYIEISILSIFIAESLCNFVAFGCLYFQDCWNVFDVIVLLISLSFVIIEINTTHTRLHGFLKIRGIFRLVRVIILIRKMNLLRFRREIRLKYKTYSEFDIASP